MRRSNGCRVGEVERGKPASMARRAAGGNRASAIARRRSTGWLTPGNAAPVGVAEVQRLVVRIARTEIVVRTDSVRQRGGILERVLPQIGEQAQTLRHPAKLAVLLACSVSAMYS